MELMLLICCVTSVFSAEYSDSAEPKAKSTSRSYSPPLHPHNTYQQPLIPHFYHEDGGQPIPLYSNPIDPGYANYRGSSSNVIPACAQNITEQYCLVDRQYPVYEAFQAVQKFRGQITESFGDVFALDTSKSIDSLTALGEELFLCRSKIQYARLLRAVDVNGRWRIIPNVEGFQQTVRLEICQQPLTACPLVPSCFPSRCVQKYVLQRLIVYHPVYDSYYNPFSTAVFRLPSSCCCLANPG